MNLVGLAGDIIEESTPLTGLHDATAEGQALGISDLPCKFGDKYGQPAAGVRRTSLNLKLKQMLLDQNIEVREGWELERIEETETSVTAFFNGCRSIQGSFLVGCDGIKSATRRCILAPSLVTEGSPIYTGLTQVRLLITYYT